MNQAMLFAHLAVATVTHAALAQCGGVESLDCSVVHQSQVSASPSTCALQEIAQDVVEFTEIELATVSGAAQGPAVAQSEQSQAVESLPPEAAALASRALALRANGQAGHGEMLRHAAALVARDDSLSAAAKADLVSVLLSDVIDSPESLFDVLDAYRYWASVLDGAGRPTAAQAKYSAAVQLLDEHPSLLDRHGMVAGSLLQAAARNALLCGDVVQSARIADRLRGSSSLSVPATMRREAAFWAMMRWAEAGDRVRFQECWTSTVRDYPDAFAGENGLARRCRAEQRLGLATSPDVAFLNLLSVWNDPAVRSQPWCLTVPMHMRLLVATSPSDALSVQIAAVYEDAWSLFKANKAAWRDSLSTVEFYRYRGYSETFLRNAIVAAEDAEDWAVMLALSQDYAAEFDGPNWSVGAAGASYAQSKLSAGD
jgi:hypothetical protein